MFSVIVHLVFLYGWGSEWCWQCCQFEKSVTLQTEFINAIWNSPRKCYQLKQFFDIFTYLKKLATLTSNKKHHSSHSGSNCFLRACNWWEFWVSDGLWFSRFPSSPQFSPFNPENNQQCRKYGEGKGSTFIQFHSNDPFNFFAGSFFFSERRQPRAENKRIKLLWWTVWVFFLEQESRQ